jgi:large subunit ribosomal protein L23
MNILFKPIVTEKMTSQGDKLNRYGFVVDSRANKLQIKTAIEKTYGVSVTDINTMKYSGKRKSRFSRSGLVSGNRNSYKKAIITLAKGETIDFYSNI